MTNTENKPLWLITGCTSGLGEELARQILARGDKVIAAGRDAVRRCQPLSQLGATTIDLDLNWPDKTIQETVERACATHGRIDFLVNNAGYCALDHFEELSPRRLEESTRVNVFGTMSVSRAVFARMRGQKSGTIAVVGSMGGWEGSFGMTAYAVAKFALEGFTDVLSKEGALFGIKAIIFEPGSIDTGMVDRTRAARDWSIPVYDGLSEKANEILSTMVPVGDSARFASGIIQVLTGTGAALNKDMPLRLPLGSDALGMVRKKCQDTLKICDDWEDLITGTDKGGVRDDAHLRAAYGHTDSELQRQ